MIISHAAVMLMFLGMKLTRERKGKKTQELIPHHFPD